MKACGYEDRDGKRNSTGTAPSKKPPCFDELDAIPSDKPTTMPYFLASSSGVTDKGSEEPDSFDGENFATSDIDMTEEILNSAQINILSSAPSPAANPAPSEQESSFFSIDILLRIHLNNIKTLSPGTNILGVPGKNIKINS